MKYITSVMLKQADACADQQELFKATFGEEAELTEANMALAIEAGLNFEWLKRLLPQPTTGAYKARVDILWGVHRAQQDPLREAYETQYVTLSRAHQARLSKLLLKELVRA